MICPYCQQQNRNTAKICIQCGKPLGSGSAVGLGPILQGRYRLLRKLGQGGMGAVYLAEDTQLFGRQWVVKEMLPPTDPADQREVGKNFQREAEVLAELRHPRIPAITHYFSEGGRYYLVMEWVDGEDLEKRLERHGGPLPEREVVNYAAQVCDILEYLASQSPPIVHRDIKPANIIVDSYGAVYLVDFGIARAKPILGASVGRDTSLWGTQGYAPPEQFTGQTEPRSDVYALGATMYHLLTGRDPRDPTHQRFEPINALVPSISTGVAQIVAQMLDPVVDHRPTASELRKRFETVLQIKPLLFPGGQAAYSVQELVELCDRHWNSAIQYLRDQHIEKWLKDIGRPDLAIQAKTIRVQVNRRKRTVDPSQEMERLLRLLDPTRSPLQLDVTPTVFNLAIAPGDDVVVNVTVKSNRRYASGTIETQPSACTPIPSTFECEAPAFSVSQSVRFKPLGVASGSNRVLLLFKTRQTTSSVIVNYTIVAPLRFRSGVLVNKPFELERIALQNWEDTVYHLKNGDISRWLQSWQRADLATSADQLRPRGAAGLAELLYRINPNFASPQISVSPSRLDYGSVNKGARLEHTLTIANTAEGILWGHLSASDSFVEMDTSELICLPHQSNKIRVRVDTSHLAGTANGQGYQAALTFTSNAGTVNIPLTWSVIHPPVLKVNPTHVRVRVQSNSALQASIQVENPGGDILVGEAIPSEPWLTPVNVTTFSLSQGNRAHISFSIDANKIDLKNPQKGIIHLRSNGGESSIPVEVVNAPRFPWRLFLALLTIAPLLACILGAAFTHAGSIAVAFFAVIGFLAGLIIAMTVTLAIYVSSQD